MCFRYLWSEAGGNGAVWTPVWEQARPYAGRAVRWLHPAVGASRGRTVQAPRTGQPGQRAAGRLRLWRETLVRLVRKRKRWQLGVWHLYLFVFWPSIDLNGTVRIKARSMAITHVWEPQGTESLWGATMMTCLCHPASVLTQLVLCHGNGHTVLTLALVTSWLPH